MKFLNTFSFNMILVLPLSVLFVFSGLQIGENSLTLVPNHAQASGSGGGDGGDGGEGGDGGGELEESTKTQKTRAKRTKTNKSKVGKLQNLIAKVQSRIRQVEQRQQRLAASAILITFTIDTRSRLGEAAVATILDKTIATIKRNEKQITALWAIVSRAEAAVSRFSG